MGLRIPSRKTGTTLREADQTPTATMPSAAAMELACGIGERPARHFSFRRQTCPCTSFWWIWEALYNCIYEVVVGTGVASSGVDRRRDSIEEGLRGLRRRRSRKDLPLPVVTRIGYRRCHSGTVQPAPKYNGCPPHFTFTAYDHRHAVCCDVYHHSYLTPDSGLPL
jgi:hypothetical protein